MNYVMEKNVPMPSRGADKIKDPAFHAAVLALAVGDCVTVPGISQAIVAARCASIARGTDDSRKFATRKVPEGIRVWRTA